MKRKILLLLVILVLLTGITLYLLNYLKIFTIQDAKDIVWAKLNTVPTIEKYLVSKEENKSLKDKLQKTNSQLMKVQDQNKELLKELKSRDKQIVEQKNNIDILKEEIKEDKVNKEQQEDRIKKLVDLYSAMGVSKAADVMEKLESRLLIKIIKGMDEEVAAEIMGEMSAELVAEISTQLSY